MNFLLRLFQHYHICSRENIFTGKSTGEFWCGHIASVWLYFFSFLLCFKIYFFFCFFLLSLIYFDMFFCIYFTWNKIGEARRRKIYAVMLMCGHSKLKLADSIVSSFWVFLLLFYLFIFVYLYKEVLIS